MGRDLPDDRYGRFFELATRLSFAHGFEVAVVCLDYRSSGTLARTEVAGVEWWRVPVSFSRPWRLPRVPASLKSVAGQCRPDVVVSASDAFCVVMGDRVSKALDVPHVADLYDNFESYPATRIPGLAWSYRRAVSRAAWVHCVSEPLAGLVRDSYRAHGVVSVLENGVDPSRFAPRDRATCGERAGVAKEVAVIGTVGALHPGRDSAVLFEAYARLRADRPDLRLVVAGRAHRSMARYLRQPGVDYLGVLDYDAVPDLVGAIDVHVICNRDSAFGRYCYPQKMWEVAASGRPFVAADVGAMSILLASRPEMRYRVGDAGDLAEKIAWQLDHRSLLDLPPVTWEDIAARMARSIEDLLEDGR